MTKITNQGSDTNKYNKSPKESRERGFPSVTKVPKITIIARITKITNQGSDTGKYNKSLKESREKGFTNVTKIPNLTMLIDTISFLNLFPAGTITFRAQEESDK